MLKKVFHSIVFILTITLFFVSIPIAFIIYGRKNIWLISEVDFDARDNGFVFFEYINREHPGVCSIYIIDKKNPNYGAVLKIGKTVKPHSYRHMLMFIAARARLSTLVHGCSPSWCVTHILLKHHFFGKNIALKHGIFKNLHPNYFKENAHLDLICCGAKPEFDFISSEFGYDNGVVQYTGLARFDKLHNKNTKNEIFIMPTWRRWLDNLTSGNDFQSSEFFLNWIGLLNSNQLINIAKNNNLDIYFYVHPKLNKFMNSFEQKDSCVHFLTSKQGDSIQKHLIDAKILITDFSSIFFDFAYMKKPIVFFQFDDQKFNESHYKKGYFDYRLTGFGPVVGEIKDVIRELGVIIDNNFCMEQQYIQRSLDFFTLCDDKNSERIYNSILGVLNDE